jgi:hypothetical protein
MGRIISCAYAFLAGAAGVALAYFKGKREGVANEKARQAEKVADMVEKSRKVDDRLAADAGYARGMRGKYTRAR